MFGAPYSFAKEFDILTQTKAPTTIGIYAMSPMFSFINNSYGIQSVYSINY